MPEGERLRDVGLVVDGAVAPGYLITLLNGLKVYVLGDHPEYIYGDPILKESKDVFALIIRNVGNNKLRCSANRVSMEPTQSREIYIPASAIMFAERVSEESFVWRAVYRAKSGLITPEEA